MGANPVLKSNSRAAVLPFARTTPAGSKFKLGLRAWMERVLVEFERASAGFDAEAVHDLRVALRRCRSLADGLMALDPDASWKQMKKAGKKVFQALGELRDMQVMQEWIEKLGGDSPGSLSTADPVRNTLLDYVRARENECKQLAFKDLDQFDRRQWRQWARMLPRRASRLRPGSLVYLHLALEKWAAAYDLHKHALRTRSQVGWHELRIGIKRLRYTVENFLPRQHELWGDDLKELQDLLGEVHDLDVLWGLAVSIGAFPDAESRVRWRDKVQSERVRRITRYRAMMVGKSSLWRSWRAELPAGPQLRVAAMSRLRVWAGYLDPDFAHSQRVAQFALLLYDGLRNEGLVAAAAGAANPGLTPPDCDPRAVLQAAALLHDVGKVKRAENHHKKSYRMIRGLARPLGWSGRELELAAVVARYHRGALPHLRRKSMQVLLLPDRPVAMELAAILRLANALDACSGRVGSAGAPQLEVQLRERCVEVRVRGYSGMERSAEEIAAARHLLEIVLRRPVLVRALRMGTGTKTGMRGERLRASAR